ncbi:MAG: hypothetical protein M3070_04155 [Actinomycetota bacterium]|nr:hypothetical protein [Actinomycetota bacterium]
MTPAEKVAERNQLDPTTGARHSSELFWERPGMLLRMRSAAAATFAAWVMFCFAAVVVWRTINGPGFDEAASVHPLIGALRWLAIAGLAGSLLVVACAALPLAVATAWQAGRRRDRVALALFAAPPAGTRNLCSRNEGSGWSLRLGRISAPAAL